jgi:hypothetical protein
MFEKGYPFRLATKQFVQHEYPLIEKLIYTFKTDKSRKYIVDIHRYEYRVYVIKFHAKSHSNSKEKYNFVLNDFDISRVLKTVLNIALEIFKNDPMASFAFVGARKADEPSNASKTQRFRVYKRVSEYFLGNVTFQHTYEERSNCYLVVNKRNANPQDMSELIIDMFAKLFQGVEHI